MNLQEALKKTWFLPFLLFLIALIFYSWNLAGQYYSLDEPGTIVVASSLASNWYPSSWNGENFISELGGAESTLHNGVYLWSWQPPLQNYLVYLGRGIFGDSVFGARFIFAIIGAFSLVAFYFIAKELFKERTVILLLCAQLLLLLPYFLYVRQVRYYGPATLFSLIMLYVGIKVWKKTCTRLDVFLISAAGVLLFLTNYVIWASSMLALLPVALYRKNKGVSLSLILQSVGAALFLWWIKPQYQADPTRANAGRPPTIVGIGKYLFYTNNYIFSFLLVPVLFYLRKTIPSVIVVLLLYIGVKILLYSLFLDAHGRYLMDLFPVFVLLMGYLYAYLWGKRQRFLLGVIFVVLAFSNIVNVFPVYLLMPQRAVLHVWPVEYQYELSVGPYLSTYERIGEYMGEREKPGDLFWSNNYRWYLYLASGVPMVSPMCDTATGKIYGPEGVTDPERIRWIIFFRNDQRPISTFTDTPCFGKKWQEKLQTEYTRITIPGIENTYLMNDPDIVGRNFPPQPIRVGEVEMYEKKQFFAAKKT